MYQLILSHTALAFVIFFFMNALISHLTTYKLKDYNSKWHVFMSIFIGIYTLFLGINTHITSEHISNSILLGHWIVSYLALFCYLNAIEFYLQKKIKVLFYPKMVFLFISSVYLISELAYQFVGKSIFFSPITSEMVTNYSKYSYITTMGSPLGVWLGYFGIVMIVFASVVIWRELSKTPRREYMLKSGIIVCLGTGAFDTAIGLGHLKEELPLFYLGFALESLRFMFHSKKLAAQEIVNLNKEVNKLSKIAQFGIVTASISHDIRNHLQIIKTSLTLLSKNPEEKYFNMANKHTDEIHNITHLYTDLFKKNLAEEKENISIQTILDNVVELTAKKLKNSKTILNITHDIDFEIQGNETELTLCIVNLVNNSIDAIRAHKEPWIQITTNNEEKTISVIDSGTGIEPQNVSKLFDFDYSTKKDEGGTGLGLGIVRQILRKHGYELSFNSEEENTTFSVYF